MAIKRAVSMMTAIALTAAPTIASAAAATAPVRASAGTSNANALESAGESWTLWVGLAIVAGVLIIALSGDDDILPEVPASP